MAKANVGMKCSKGAVDDDGGGGGQTSSRNLCIALGKTWIEGAMGQKPKPRFPTATPQAAFLAHSDNDRSGASGQGTLKGICLAAEGCTRYLRFQRRRKFKYQAVACNVAGARGLDLGCMSCGFATTWAVGRHNIVQSASESAGGQLANRLRLGNPGRCRERMCAWPRLNWMSAHLKREESIEAPLARRTPAHGKKLFTAYQVRVTVVLVLEAQYLSTVPLCT
jgi:hypothetical protein